MKDNSPYAVSLKDACVLAGVQKDAIYAAINSGELPSLKIGKRRLFRPESIQAWIAKKESEMKVVMGIATPSDGSRNTYSRAKGDRS